MHGGLLLSIGLLLGAPPPKAASPAPDAAPPKLTREQELLRADRQVVEAAGLKTGPEQLTAFFRSRTLDEADRRRAEGLADLLGGAIYRDRVRASAELIALGPRAVDILRRIATEGSLEARRRAELCLQRIAEKDVGPEVPAAAARLLAAAPTEATVPTLFAYLPFADNDNVAEEVRTALRKLGHPEGEPHPVLRAGLKNPSAVLRAGAGEALADLAEPAEVRAAVRDLLRDQDPFVRVRVASALVLAGERDAVPVLIDVLPRLSLHQAWQAEDLLYRLGEGKTPPAVSLGRDAATREKCRDAWAAWWKTHGAKVDLARLSRPPRLLGYTLIALLDLGRILELGADNQPRWQVDGLLFPLDIQMLGEDRFLAAEYHAGRVAERDLKGEIVWEKRVAGPLVAQRLTNGNTFIATESQLLEYDRADKEVLAFSFPNGEKVMKAMKLPSGEIACLTSEARIVRLDPQGKELFSFSISLDRRLYGGRLDMLPSGRVVVPHNAENKVVEYDSRGKVVWEVNVEQPVAAVRLPNGNTLVTTMLPQTGAVEFDRTGREVWNYRTNTRVTRALKR